VIVMQHRMLSEPLLSARVLLPFTGSHEHRCCNTFSTALAGRPDDEYVFVTVRGCSYG